MAFHRCVALCIRSIPPTVNSTTQVRSRSACLPLVDPETRLSSSALLWSSPEIIRDPHAPVQGTQKDDVYSFSIILHEIIYRRGLFAMNETSVSAKDIFQSIHSGNELRPPFLGDTAVFEIGNLMKRCWQENPADRPDFTSILNTMKKLSK